MRRIPVVWNVLCVLSGLSVVFGVGVLPAAGPPDMAAAVLSTPQPGRVAGWPGSPGGRGLVFEPNAGQSAPRVRFLARLPGGLIFFTPTEVVLAGGGGPARAAGPQGAAPHPGGPAPATAVRLHLTWEGANPAPGLTADGLLPGRINYLRGPDPAAWHTNLPTYSGLTYQNLYPGIDLHYAGPDGHLKGTYTVAAGADPALIRWRYPGAGRAQIDPAGNLHVPVTPDPSGPPITVTEAAPLAWQPAGDQQVPVAVHYVVGADAAVSFVPASYDRSRPLIIDPSLTYSTFFEGGGSAEATAIAVDGSGNAYVGGETFSPEFPADKGAPAAGDDSRNVIAGKLSADGSTWIYRTIFGGSGDDWGFGLGVDGTGSVYLTGLTSSSDFPLVNPLQPQYGGGATDAFVVKLNPTGTAFDFATYLGGSGDDQGQGLAVDAAGAVYLSGWTRSADFPTTPGAFQTGYHGGGDVYVAKLDPARSTLVYATYLGGSGDDTGGVEQQTGLAIDSSGAAYVTGGTKSADFPVTPGVFQPTCRSCPTGDDSFVTKLDPAGATLIYSTFLGGQGEDAGAGIAVDGAGNAYVTGLTNSLDFPLAGPSLVPYRGGSYDATVTMLNTDGSMLIYSRCLGGSYDDRGRAIAVDSQGAAFVAGYTDSGDFPVQNPVQTAFGGVWDAYVVKLGPGGTTLDFATYLGGEDDDYFEAIALDAAGNAYMTGASASADWPVVGPPVPPAHNGDFSAVISKLDIPAQVPLPCGIEYTDVPPGSPFYAPVHTLACQGVVGGYGDGTFRPETSITRGQLAKMITLASMISVPVPANQQTFADLPPANPFWAVVEELAGMGLVSGYACGGADEPCDAQARPYFRPATNVTRGQIAKIVALAAAYQGMPAGQLFADVLPGAPFYEPIQQLAGAGGISGHSCGVPDTPCLPPADRPYFQPGDPVTRGQAAKIIVNTLLPAAP